MTLQRVIRVSILVVLDDALVLTNNLNIKVMSTKVSILVVLDDALVQAYSSSSRSRVHGLNPCCAGRCPSTDPDCPCHLDTLVSILVVLDDALVQAIKEITHGYVESQSLLCWTMP